MTNRVLIDKMDRGVRRRQVFLETALNVFCERGYASVNVNEIVQHAGGSLATLYSQFGSKNGLVEAVLKECISRFTAALAPDIDPQLPLRDGLQRIGEHHLRQAMNPQARRLVRVLCAASGEFPEAAKECLRVSSDRIARAIADYIALHSSEEALFEHHEEVALTFCAMVREPHHCRAVLDDNYDLSDAEVTAHVRRAVALLLDGTACASKPGR